MIFVIINFYKREKGDIKRSGFLFVDEVLEEGLVIVTGRFLGRVVGVLVFRFEINFVLSVIIF